MLFQIIVRTLDQDIQRTLDLHEHQVKLSQRHWLWCCNPPWAERRPQTLVSEDNVETMQSILGQIQKL